MERLYHASNSIVEDIHQCFKKYEVSVGEEAQRIEGIIQERINELSSNCERLAILASKEPVSRRQNAKMRVDELRYEQKHLQAALANLQRRRFEREEALQSREELLSKKFATNDSRDTAIYIDESLQFHSRAQSANRNVDDLIGSGSSILTSLREQRTTLKGAHRKILDVANTLGMSNTVMRMIERRTYQDKFILFGGMFVTCVVMFLVVKYLA
ncbi:golgi SNAP receptor complex member 2 [Amblyomma americanum]|uniref:Golgi SNAP receptor complex member 2 n=1 Tax=Amblyomma americanum TaxID=6943 RepID=A0AAQ4E6J4_AMBAM